MLCQVAGKAQQGQACVLQCANDKYMRVGKRAVALPAGTRFASSLRPHTLEA
jgi:hypothetical protein